MLQTAMNITQMQNIKADTKVKEAEAEKIKGVDTEYTKSQTDVNSEREEGPATAIVRSYTSSIKVPPISRVSLITLI